MIIVVNFAIGRKKPEKYQGFNGIRTPDLRDTGAMLDQLSCETKIGSEVNLLSSYLPVQWNDAKSISHSYCTAVVDESEEWSSQ